MQTRFIYFVCDGKQFDIENMPLENHCSLTQIDTKCLTLEHRKSGGVSALACKIKSFNSLSFPHNNLMK